MNQVAKKFSLVLAVASAVLLAACQKTPVRPDPGQTAMGMGVGGPRAGEQPYGPQNVPITNGPETLTPRGEFDRIDDGNTIRFEFGAASQVFFDFDRSEIKQSERAKFPAVKKYLEEHPGTRILFEGHCDWRGTAEYNLALGERRAGAAKKYLQSLGVKANLIETTSKGSLEAAKNGDDATMAKDRRVDIVIIKAPTGAPAPATAKTL